MTSFRSLLRSLHLSQVEYYLQEAGWQLSEAAHRERVYSYTDKNRDVAYVKVPMIAAASNVVDRLYHVVYIVSCIEDRQPMEVALDMQQRAVVVPAAVSLQDVLRDALSQLTGITDALLDELTEELEPSVTRAEFMTAGMGSGGSLRQLASVKAAMVLVPTVQRVDLFDDSDGVGRLICGILTSLFGLTSPPSSQWLRQVQETALQDNADAPTKTLGLLAQLADR